MSRAYLVLVALALGCFLQLSAGQASVSHIGCGDTITADTTLEGDLSDCPNNGIVIGPTM